MLDIRYLLSHEYISNIYIRAALNFEAVVGGVL